MNILEQATTFLNIGRGFIFNEIKQDGRQDVLIVIKINFVYSFLLQNDTKSIHNVVGSQKIVQIVLLNLTSAWGSIYVLSLVKQKNYQM